MESWLLTTWLPCGNEVEVSPPLKPAPGRWLGLYSSPGPFVSLVCRCACLAKGCCRLVLHAGRAGLTQACRRGQRGSRTDPGAATLPSAGRGQPQPLSAPRWRLRSANAAPDLARERPRRSCAFRLARGMAGGPAKVTQGCVPTERDPNSLRSWLSSKA